ncbi:Lrp/AsnC family transcriptional regulator [Enterococcus sp. AZ072]|uniref:Lrp/AsnC family transcriptional regulator n=1 Tax=unclassified Enterococcus TaxID=2608891 RepID=UPI003D2A6129
MDRIDLEIIAELKKNGRLSASQISKNINLSVPTVSERMKRLEATNIIEGYTIKVNRKKNNENLLAFILVNLDGSKISEGFQKLVSANNAILECHHIAGAYDYLLKIALEDTTALDNFLSNVLNKSNGVRNSNTIIVLSTLKEEMNT